MEGPLGREARVRIFDQATDVELANVVVTLSPRSPDSGLPFVPGFAQLPSLTEQFPQLVAAPLVRITVEPLTEDLRFWAFVSVTNSETQHVTLVTPQ
jgi:hypothetical protein